MSLLLHRSPFVDTSAGPADVQSLNKFLHQIKATLLLQSTKKLLGSANATSSATMRGRMTAWDMFS